MLVVVVLMVAAVLMVNGGDGSGVDGSSGHGDISGDEVLVVVLVLVLVVMVQW